jgi:hypothetical protein
MPLPTQKGDKGQGAGLRSRIVLLLGAFGSAQKMAAADGQSREETPSQQNAGTAISSMQASGHGRAKRGLIHNDKGAGLRSR